MKCEICRHDFPSKHYFAADALDAKRRVCPPCYWALPRDSSSGCRLLPPPEPPPSVGLGMLARYAAVGVVAALVSVPILFVTMFVLFFASGGGWGGPAALQYGGLVFCAVLLWGGLAAAIAGVVMSLDVPAVSARVAAIVASVLALAGGAVLGLVGFAVGAGVGAFLGMFYRVDAF